MKVKSLGDRDALYMSLIDRVFKVKGRYGDWRDSRARDRLDLAWANLFFGPEWDGAGFDGAWDRSDGLDQDCQYYGDL